MSAFHVELLLFTYISQEESGKFDQRLRDWGLNGFSRAVPAQAPSKPIDLWDYPYYQENEVSDQSRIISIVETAAKANVTLTKTTLKEIRIVYIDSPPAHYPFQFVLAFRFTGNPSPSMDSREHLRGYLDIAAEETKIFIKWIFEKAQYRPIYWLFTDLPTSLQGINGTINKIRSPDGSELRIERAFPKFSYARRAEVKTL
jgi:hypothetical protein